MFWIPIKLLSNCAAFRSVFASIFDPIATFATLCANLTLQRHRFPFKYTTFFLLLRSWLSLQSLHPLSRKRWWHIHGQWFWNLDVLVVSLWFCFYSGVLFILARCPSFCFHELSHAILSHWYLARQLPDRVSYWIYFLRVAVCHHIFAWKNAALLNLFVAIKAVVRAATTSARSCSIPGLHSWGNMGFRHCLVMFNCVLGMPSKPWRALLMAGRAVRKSGGTALLCTD